MCSGSVLHRASVWAVPASALAVVINLFFYHEDTTSGPVISAWYSYSFLLSFLVVFRTQQAYSRYWEGASLLHKAKGDWLNAMSCVIAFCTNDPAMYTEVKAFQHAVVRLMSLLHCTALQQVAMMDDEAFDIIELVGIDLDKLQHLTANPDNKCLILLQWIQKMLVKGLVEGILTVPAPIMTRTFQQLGNGYTNLIDAQKITDIPFPFPYTQMVSLLLFVATFVTPIVTGLNIESPFWAGGLTFFGIFGFWAINFIAAEIEMPYGDDTNDLPIAEIQKEMNRDLKILIHSETQQPPMFRFLETSYEALDETPCSEGLISHLQEQYVKISVRNRIGDAVAAKDETRRRSRASRSPGDRRSAGGAQLPRRSTAGGEKGFAAQDGSPCSTADVEIEIKAPEDNHMASKLEMDHKFVSMDTVPMERSQDRPRAQAFALNGNDASMTERRDIAPGTKPGPRVTSDKLPCDDPRPPPAYHKAVEAESIDAGVEAPI